MSKKVKVAVREKVVYGEEYPKVRKLTRKDRKKLSNLLVKYLERSGNTQLASMVPGLPQSVKDKIADTSKPSDAETEVNAYELIKSVFSGLLEFVETDLTKWFMKITNTESQDEYDALPFDIEFYIYDQCACQAGFKNFFTRALDLYRGIQG